jgi:glycosyltransferase involved in cell wall biosynthesis
MMDIGFVHNRWPGAEGAGSTVEANIIVRGLRDRGHDVTVFCHQTPESGVTEPGFDIVDLRVPDGDRLRGLRNRQRFSNAFDRLDHDFGRYDVVHSYVAAAIPGLAAATETASTRTLVSLVGYGSLCPKKDLLYMDDEPCTSNGLTRCLNCATRTLLSQQGSRYDVSALQQYSGAKRLPALGYSLADRYSNLSHVLEVRRHRDRFDGYHTTTDHMKAKYSAFGFPGDDIEVIPGVLDERFLIEHRSDFEEPFDLLYVGELRRKKGVSKLVPLLDRLLDTGTEFRLTVVGDGPMESTLADQTRERGLEDAVTFEGHVPFADMPAFYADHDLLVYPGVLDEPFGRIFVECLATGTPVVGSRVGAFERIVGEGGVATDGTVAGFAEAITDLVARDELQRMSEAGRERAVVYRPDRIIDQFEALYRALM